MMTTKHTPGPWEIEPKAGRGVWIGHKGEWAALACGTSDANAAANAVLIAAAPDLLAALKKLANAEKEYRYLHDHMGGDRPETGRAWDLMRRAGDDARTVIEAAEGKP